MSANIQISQILLDASSPDAETRKVAEAKLKEWERAPNFYPTLLVFISFFFVFCHLVFKIYYSFC